MPLITIEILPQELEKKKEIVKVFTEELSRITGIPKEPITIIFHESPADNFSAGGELLSERFKNRK